MHVSYWTESQEKQLRQLRHMSLHYNRWILELEDGLLWNGLFWPMVRRAIVNMVIHFRIL
jgi:hypothetical protein